MDVLLCDVAHLQFLVCQVFSELFGHPLQVLKRDLACFVVVKQPERFKDLLFGVFLSLKIERAILLGIFYWKSTPNWYDRSTLL